MTLVEKLVHALNRTRLATLTAVTDAVMRPPWRYELERSEYPVAESCAATRLSRAAALVERLRSPAPV